MRNKSSESGGTHIAAPRVKQQGLTLVELLVAISMLGVVAILGWRGLDGIVRSRIALTGDLEQTRGMQLAFAQMQSDCAHLAGTAILQGRTPLSIKQGRLILVRTVFSENQPSRLQFISYAVRGGMLVRHESAATRDLRELDAMWRTAENDVDMIPAVTLQSDVTAMTMRLWVNGNWRSDSDALMPATFVGVPPNSLLSTGLEVTLRLRGRDAGLLKIFLLGAV